MRLPDRLSSSGRISSLHSLYSRNNFVLWKKKMKTKKTLLLNTRVSIFSKLNYYTEYDIILSSLVVIFRWKLCDLCLLPAAGILPECSLFRGGRNRSIQYGNMGCCRWQSPTVYIIAVLFENKVHLKLFKRRARLHPDGFPVKIILRFWFKQILIFFYL